jgi:hypothetical protein
LKSSAHFPALLRGLGNKMPSYLKKKNRQLILETFGCSGEESLSSLSNKGRVQPVNKSIPWGKGNIVVNLSID